jgi:uncharacterized protein YcaQ
MASARTSLSASQARRLGLAAQGFTDPRPTGRVDRRHVRRLFDRVDVVQIDSVNVLVRSQELPLFARIGAHPRDLLPRMTGDAELFEYWCHEASLLPIDHFPLMRWRMSRAIDDMWGSMRSINDDPGYLEAVLAEVRERGPLAAGELSDPGAKTTGMWGWNKGKRALEHLFWSGAITARRRPGDFARVYDLTERMIPAAVLARPAPAEDDAKRTLLERAARAVGVGTARDLADYHRINLPKARPLLADLVEDGRLLPVTVEGWPQPAYLHPAATIPRRVDARALLSPFDSLIWERSRTERLFGFHYRIEIYTPAAKRRFGYYVLPFLLGDRLVARVDLKADRQAKVLRVQRAYLEPGEDEAFVAGAMAAELGAMAGWLGLDGVAVVDRGDLAPTLTRAVEAPCA